MKGSISESISFSNTFERADRTLDGLKFLLQFGSSALKAGVTPDFYRLPGKVFSSK